MAKLLTKYMWWVLVLEQLFLTVHESEEHVSGDGCEYAAYCHVKGEGSEIYSTVALQKESLYN